MSSKEIPFGSGVEILSRFGATFSHNLPLMSPMSGESKGQVRGRDHHALASLIGRRVSIRLHEAEGGYRDLLGTLVGADQVERRDGSIVTFDPAAIFVFREVLPKGANASSLADGEKNMNEGGKGTGVSIYDTLSRQVRQIQSSDYKEVRIYCCGPTVYRDAHVGNLRTFLLTDLVRRSIEFAGFKVKVIQNITDVGHMSEDFDEDKILKESKERKRDPFEIAREYESKFHRDLALLKIKKADHYPRASECIEMMHQHISLLMDKGLAYQGEDGSVYFSSERFESYGALSGNRLSDLKPGHRYEFTEAGAKRFHADWALWKSAGARREMIWDSPWGKGFPGWHIECSAMSLHFLNGHIDLHIGGIDLRFPHHENERAQSNPVANDLDSTNEAVDLWLHGEHLLFEGRKMSKSAGNVVLLSDVIARGLDPLAVRFCFLENRYRSQMDLSWASITAADRLLRRWRERFANQALSTSHQPSPQATLIIDEIASDFAQDLDTPRALQRLRSLEKDESFDESCKSEIFAIADRLLGLDLMRVDIQPKRELSQEDSGFLQARIQARASKDYAESDRLRELLAERGIEVRDELDGQVWDWK